MRSARLALLSSCALLALASAHCGGGSDALFDQSPAPGADASDEASIDGGAGADGSAEACVAVTCVELGAECGAIPDGCGHALQCGECADGKFCGGAGPNKCGDEACVPLTCAGLCGDVADGCGELMSCGGCVSPQTCGGAGVANQCGCTPKTCEQAGAACGGISDGCGNTRDCGGCPDNQTCGGDQPNQCGDTPCVPTTCVKLGYKCGFAGDGCSGTLDCGHCSGNDTCGGNGVANQCGCKPKTCAQMGAQCGTIDDGCGATATCPQCPAPKVCGGAGEPNKCAAAITTLASEFPFPWALATDSTRVYFGSNTSAGAIGAVAKTGGTPVILASGQEYVEGIAVGSTAVFWTQYFGGELKSVGLDGSGLATLASDTANGIGVAVDATSVFWAWNNLDGGRVMVRSQSGGSYYAKVTGQSDARYIAVHADKLYYTVAPSQISQGRVRSVALAGGGTPTDIATGQYEPNAIAADASGVYWTRHNAYERVMRANLDGSGLTELAKGQNRPHFIAIDATHVYWTNEGSPASQYKDGSVMRVKKTGGTPEVLVDNQAHPAGIAVDATSVYWANAASGSILKMGK